MWNKKLGYYTVGNKQFEKKIEALLYATKVYYQLININKSITPMSIVKWVFNDEVFSSYDWTIEPSNTLKYFYHKRAKQLREIYDYIIISYSGGADSHNIVMSFLDQGLHIDELYVIMMEKNTNEWTTLNTNSKKPVLSYVSDNYLQTVPRLKEIISKSPNTKIRYLDMTDLVPKVFRSYKDASWVLNMREELNPVDVTRYAYSFFSEFKKSLDKYQNVGILVGIDKPRILIDSFTKQVFFRFTDRLTNAIPIGQYIKEYTNTTTEFFYWSPDSCDLMCKQAHTVKKWLRANPNLQNFYLNTPMPSLLFSNVVDVNRVFSERLLVPIIYDTWNKSWFQSTKNSRDWFLECDNWFIKGAAGTTEHSIWLEGIKYIIDNIRPYIESPSGFPDHFSKWYKDYYVGNLYN